MQCVKIEIFFERHKEMWKKLKETWIDEKKKDLVSSIIFLDTETTGIPIMAGYNKYHDPEELKYYKNCRIIELGYVIAEEETKLQYTTLVKTKTIKNTEIHGITSEMTLKHGKTIETVLDDLLSHINKHNVDTLVCHNAQFDLCILLSECYRAEKLFLAKKLKTLNIICTMDLAKKSLGLYKNPKLNSLYELLFKENQEQQHRALSDALMCQKCYIKICTKLNE
jgi:DNA polymerase III epsilon subunit-like protein